MSYFNVFPYFWQGLVQGEENWLTTSKIEGGKRNSKWTKGRPEVIISIVDENKSLFVWCEFFNALNGGGMSFLCVWCLLTWDLPHLGTR